MTFGGSGAYTDIGTVQQNEADTLLARVIEAGINFVDTADTYSSGASERITGQALKNLGIARDDVVVATKVFGETGSSSSARGSSRGHILDAAKASLMRLQLDHIDLYQLHGFDPATPIEETLGALDDLGAAGPCALCRSFKLGRLADRELDDNLGAVDVVLSDDDLRALDQVSALPAEYPGWMLNIWSDARAKQLNESRT